MPTISDAIALAARAHEGQTDLGGAPFIFHPLRVMLGAYRSVPSDPSADSLAIVGVLHDVIEDSKVTMSDLIAQHYDGEIIRALDAITRREGENYGDYILRVGDNEWATRVKLADLTDNLDPARPSTGKLSAKMLQRYRIAQGYLEIMSPGERDSLRASMFLHRLRWACL